MYLFIKSQWIKKFNLLVSGATWSSSSFNQNATCSFCLRTFVNNANLKIHIRDVHSVNKGPFVCNICGKVVKNRGSLRVHTYRFHTAKSKWTFLLLLLSMTSSLPPSLCLDEEDNSTNQNGYLLCTEIWGRIPTSEGLWFCIWHNSIDNIFLV